MDQNKIRYAVVGLGHIAQTAILPAFKNCKNSQLTTLISGDSEKLEEISKKYKVPHTYDYADYDRALKSGQFDAVYLAVPNHLHKDFTVRAAQNKIHVLCEKPMAVTSEECLEMIHTCDENQTKLMIAYRLHFEETHLRAIQLIHKEKKLGDPRMLQSIHSQPTQFPNIRTLPSSQGGGPTYDMGIYDINAARYLFQDEPISVLAKSAKSGKPPFHKIEETMSVILKFPQERLASIIFSFGTVKTDTLRVVGTQGELSIDPAYTYVGDKSLCLSIEGKTHEQNFKARDHFSPEIDYFSECIQNNREVEPSGLEGLADLRVIEAVYESARSGQLIQMEPRIQKSKPDMSQKITRPPVEKPDTTKVQAPSKKKAA